MNNIKNIRRAEKNLRLYGSSHYRHNFEVGTHYAKEVVKRARRALDKALVRNVD